MRLAPSNSGLKTKNDLGTTVKVSDAGVDTVSYCWRPNDDELWQWIRRGLDRGVLEHPEAPDDAGDAPARLPFRRLRGRMEHAGPLFGSPVALRGVRWFVMPDVRLIYCEGRLVQILQDDRRAEGLGRLAFLPRGALLAALEFSQVGVPLFPDEPVALRRMDPAVDLSFDDPTRGRAFLQALHDADARRHAWTRSGADHGATVEWHDGQGICFRAYDYGVGHGVAAPGGLIRLEAQQRWRKGQQPTPERAGEGFANGAWDELMTIAQSLPPLGSMLDAVEVINAAHEQGELNSQEATTRLGHVLSFETGGRAWWPEGEDRTQRRAEQRLGQLGIEVVKSGDGQAWCRPAPALRPGPVVRLAFEALRATRDP
jgi:hypothetical protein